MARRGSGENNNDLRPLGPTGAPYMPGSNPGQVEAIHGLLVRELEPKDGIERLWLGDVAYLTVRLEHMRLMIKGYYLKILHAELRRIAWSTSSSIFTDDELDVLEKMAESDFELGNNADVVCVNLYGRLLAIAVQDEMDKLKLLDDLEKGLLRERDRVFAQFERRRRNQVIEAVKVLETPSVALPVPGT